MPSNMNTVLTVLTLLSIKICSIFWTIQYRYHVLKRYQPQFSLLLLIEVGNFKKLANFQIFCL